MIERLSGRIPDTSVDPDEAVALGAAILADLETGPPRTPVSRAGSRM